MDIYVHRIGRTCRSVDGSASGKAITLFTQENKQFAFQLVKFFQVSEQKVPPALRALASGVTEKEVKKGSVGLGFMDQDVMKYGERDAFESYYEKEKETKSEGVAVGSSQGVYQTMYDPSSNTYTMVNRQPSVSAPLAPASTAVNGFVRSNRQEEHDIPVSAYGGPDDEWDSSMMAMESALAAIQARRKEKMGSKEDVRVDRSRRSHSRSRHSHSRSHRSHSRSHRSHSRSHRSHHHSHRHHYSRSRSRSGSRYSSHRHRSGSRRHHSYSCLFGDSSTMKRRTKKSRLHFLLPFFCCVLLAHYLNETRLRRFQYDSNDNITTYNVFSNRIPHFIAVLLTIRG